MVGFAVVARSMGRLPSELTGLRSVESCLWDGSTHYGVRIALMPQRWLACLVPAICFAGRRSQF
ncbi:hypothetical protein CEE69_23470 [Rhodopirellula bahusiensis]|uniref:Uncharacterized protein n=1 Tax=Rhodopirellula bahusiensis TaxID=2014065 RepID=A0A2G1W2P1_9BACT|nr:hypothetical protein CEE69_23470 [Rhodopirellula bahusiensis]